jgi:type II secretory pathway pseudopilin PulG
MNTQQRRNIAGRIPERGYALVEVLVSAAIACAVLGVILQFAVAAQGAVRTQADVADLQQRLRVTAEAIRHDLLRAGAGPSHGAWRAPLADVFAPILPARAGTSGADAELSYHADRISITYVADAGPQTALLAAMPSPGAPLVLAGCPAGPCAFAAGDRVLIFEPFDARGAHEVFTVAAFDPAGPTLSASAPLTRAYAAGSPVVGVIQHVYYLDRPGKRIMMYDGDRSDLPLVDHVVDLRFTYYGDPRPRASEPPPAGAASCAYAPGSPPVPLLEDLGGSALKVFPAARLTDGPVCGEPPYTFDADLLRVRRIGVTIRLETESTEFRGSGPAFLTPGSSADANRMIPDLVVAFDVSPRNMAVR